MSIERGPQHDRLSEDIAASVERTRELFTDTLRFMTDRYCPDIGKALTATAVITLATMIDLHHVRRMKEQVHG